MIVRFPALAVIGSVRVAGPRADLSWVPAFAGMSGVQETGSNLNHGSMLGVVVISDLGSSSRSSSSRTP